jgi:hypothetical protein
MEIQTITQKDAAVGAKLNTYDLHFLGRIKGALGVSSTFVVKVYAENMKKAELALYQEFEHISVARCLAGHDPEGKLLPTEELMTGFDILCASVFQDLIDNGETPDSANATISSRVYQMTSKATR